MEPDLVFTACSRFVLPAWLLLIIAPRWEWTHKLIFHAWIPILLGIAYAYCMSQALPFKEGGGFGSLEQVMVLFNEPWLAVAGWIHYLVFDLFVGAWIVRDSRRHNISHVWVIPSLVLTFLAGPVGLLLYLLVRAALRKVMSTQEVYA